MVPSCRELLCTDRSQVHGGTQCRDTEELPLVGDCNWPTAGGYERRLRRREPRRMWGRRRAVLERAVGPLWVDCRPTRPTADRHPILWRWFSETALRRPAALRFITDAHAVSVIGSGGPALPAATGGFLAAQIDRSPLRSAFRTHSARSSRSGRHRLRPDARSGASRTTCAPRALNL
jgi:hypothetical protein